jgi:hypothetical protein
LNEAASSGNSVWDTPFGVRFKTSREDKEEATSLGSAVSMRPHDLTTGKQPSQSSVRYFVSDGAVGNLIQSFFKVQGCFVWILLPIEFGVKQLRKSLSFHRSDFWGYLPLSDQLKFQQTKGPFCGTTSHFT